jgi:hypothetical protein
LPQLGAQHDTQHPAPRTPHPYLDAVENPSAALFRLLQRVPNFMDETTAYTLDEARFAEAIGYQANKVHTILTEGIAALLPLLPPLPPLPYNAPAPLASLCNIMAHLTDEAEATKTIANSFFNMAADFFADNLDYPQVSDIAVFERELHTVTVAKLARAVEGNYERHDYFRLLGLMQLLPGDITNVPRLTPEQGRMCQTVGNLASRAKVLLWSGVKAINNLSFLLYKVAPDMHVPDTSAFVAQLKAEYEFMCASEENYWRAASHVFRDVQQPG